MPWAELWWRTVGAVHGRKQLRGRRAERHARREKGS
eukprot:SAG11_NODE_1529_length_4738_cov_1.628799_3_plen_36_part_00